MGFSACKIVSFPDTLFCENKKNLQTHHCSLWGIPFWRIPSNFRFSKSHNGLLLIVKNGMEMELGSKEEEKRRYRWVKVGPDISEDQKLAISQLPPMMSNRCKAFMKQIICYEPQNGSLSDLLAFWVKSMKPRRADWLLVLKELRLLEHPLYLEVTLTTLVHMYSKAGKFNLAEDIFDEMRLLGVPLDRRSYGSMVMAYIRAGMLNMGESLLKEVAAEENYAGREVYKALLRPYSMNGDSGGAQRVFDAMQLAGIIPDAKMCGLLINAYVRDYVCSFL